MTTVHPKQLLQLLLLKSKQNQMKSIQLHKKQRLQNQKQITKNNWQKIFQERQQQLQLHLIMRLFRKPVRLVLTMITSLRLNYLWINFLIRVTLFHFLNILKMHQKGMMALMTSPQPTADIKRTPRLRNVRPEEPRRWKSNAE